MAGDFDSDDFDSDDFDISGAGPSAAFIEAVNSRETEQVFIFLVSMTHEDLEEPIYFASDTHSTLSTGNPGVLSNSIEYTYVPFTFILPTLEADSIPTSKISIDNVSREIVAAINNIANSPDVRIQIVLSSDPDVIEYDLQGFKIGSVTYDAMTIEGDLNVEQYFNEPYPSVRFTPSRFPGLFRGRSSEVGV